MAHAPARPREHGNGQSEQPAPGTRESGQQPAEPWWQWLIAGLGALLVIGTAGYLAWRGVSAPEHPPAVTLSVQRIEASGSGYVVIVEARNRGGETAAGLTVRGELRRDGQLLGESEFTLDYLPANATRRGGLFFTQDPRIDGIELRLEPSGYSQP